jgi:hypothetical protein
MKRIFILFCLICFNNILNAQIETDNYSLGTKTYPISVVNDEKTGEISVILGIEDEKLLIVPAINLTEFITFLTEVRLNFIELSSIVRKINLEGALMTIGVESPLFGVLWMNTKGSHVGITKVKPRFMYIKSGAFFMIIDGTVLSTKNRRIQTVFSWIFWNDVEILNLLKKLSIIEENIKKGK